MGGLFYIASCWRWVKNKSFFNFMVLTPLQWSTAVLYPEKKYGGGNLSPTPHQRLEGQDTLVGIGFIKLTESSDTLNYKLFVKHCI